MSNLLRPMTTVVLRQMVKQIINELNASGYPITLELVLLLIKARLKRIDEFHNP